MNRTDADAYRIALYYCYTPIPDIDQQLAFQKSICESHGLLGRIRVSHEGVNGVLSGLFARLQDYEEELKKDLLCLRRLVQQNDREESSSASNVEFELDIKYCHLRSDLPFEQQLFDSLSVKETREVVSLYEPTPEEMRCMSRRNSRRRRRKHNLNAPGINSKEVDSNETSSKDDYFQPAPHLSPQEWNKHLLSVKSDAIFLDARNVYESRVGHFSVEGVPTLLTNTRKYSSLPSVLESSVPELAGKHVFMYCTGGVRCEQASVCLQQLAVSDKWKDYPKPKGIYQLNGGIQRYLEQYGSRPMSSSGTKPDCLYRGKNFVFDPRRTDPMVGGQSLGRCLLCQCPHDDYDNGHAPSENREARCCRCRVLVLVCNDCRAGVRSCGEQSENPDLLCGGQECIDEGNSVHQAEIVLDEKADKGNQCNL